MTFRRTLTFLILALAFALTAGAQQKPFTHERVATVTAFVTVVFSLDAEPAVNSPAG